MTERQQDQPAERPSETRQFLRMFGDDIADEVKYAAMFLVAMVPAGLIGYLVAGGGGAVVGAIAGAGLVIAYIVVSVAWEMLGVVRRRGNSGDRDRP